MQETQQKSGETGSNEIRFDFPSQPQILADVRKMVEQAADKTNLGKEQIEDLLTAVDEAAANAIRHGSPRSGPDAIVRITCLILPDCLEVRVRDFGAGFSIPEMAIMPAPDAMGGRGLPLMVALADSVAISSTTQGATVTLVKRFEALD